MDIEYYRQFEPIFGAWKIVQELGEGSFGKVFEIEKEEFGAVYRSALKVITIPQSKSDLKNAEADGMDEASIATYYRSFVEDFSRESSIMAKLKGHTNIVSFEDTQIIEHKDSIGWDIFIRMELLTPLNDHIKAQGGRLSADQIIKLGCDLCKALEVCEKNNIIHRDIKPENIFVSSMGDYELGDFGISRMAEKTSGASTKVGTKDYMAPEVYRGEKYDRTVDTYSLSIVLYKLLNNNRLPFLPPAPEPITFNQRNEALDKRMSGVLIPAIPGIDSKLSQVILKGCSYDPSARFLSAGEFLYALQNSESYDGSCVLPVDTPVTNVTAPETVDGSIEHSKTEYAKTEYVPKTVNGSVSEENNKPAYPISALLKNKKALIIAVGAAALVAILIGVAAHSSKQKNIVSDEIDEFALENTYDDSNYDIEPVYTEEQEEESVEFTGELIKTADILNGSYDMSFNVPRIQTIHGKYEGNEYFNEYLYSEYKTADFDQYGDTSGQTGYLEGLDTFTLYTYGDPQFEDSVYNFYSIPYSITGMYNGKDRMWYYSYFQRILDYKDPILDRIENKEEVLPQEVLFDIFATISDRKGYNQNITQEDVNTLYDKYGLDEWGLVTLDYIYYLRYPDLIGTYKYSGYYKINGNRMLILLIYVNEDSYGFIPIEYSIDFNENDDLVMSYGNQSRVLENQERLNGVVGVVANGEIYNNIIRIDPYHAAEGVVQIEDVNGLQADATIDSLTNNSISFSWIGVGYDDSWENRHSIKESGNCSFKYHVVENTDKAFEGLIIIDGNTSYLYFNDTLTYLTAKLSDNLSDDVDISTLSDSKLQELTESQQNIANDMQTLMDAGGISANDYTYNAETGKVTFNEGILFDTGKSELKEQAYNVIEAFSPVYTQLYSMHSDEILCLEIDGHADSTGSDAINQPLSESRAQAVASAMNTNCQIEAKGYGSSNPVLNEDGTENKDASRRVEFRIILRVD